MEGVVFAPYYGVLEEVHDDRKIIDGCFGKNVHYPRPEDDEWEDWNKELMKLLLKYKKQQRKNNRQIIM